MNVSSQTRPTTPVIALLTDFGQEGWYVGVMKGVIASICPEANVIDICHAVAPQAVTEGAIMLSAAYKFFPPGTVFVAVVDPGVGTAREPVILKGGGYYFIAPNNGVLSVVAQQLPGKQCHRLTNTDYMLPDQSATFHGRDLFAPAAAHLAAGVEWTLLAPHKTNLFNLAISTASFDSGIVEGNIVFFDHFGNALTNISRELHEEAFGQAVESEALTPPLAVHIDDWVIPRIGTTYADVPIGEAIAYWGSTGNLEIGINHGNARTQLHLKLLDKVSIRQHGKIQA